MIAEIRARLTANAMPPLVSVAGAISLAALEDSPPQAARLPAAYVVPLADSAGANLLAAGGSHQEVTGRIGVVLAIGAMAQRDGARASDDIDPLIAAIRAALAGWQPASAEAPLEFARGAIAGITKRIVWWMDEYTIKSSLRSV